jgi:hypothetical protein
MNEDASELIDLYEQGLLPRGELLNKLIELSLSVEPERYFDDLPEDIKEEISDIVREPPKSPEDVFIIKYPTFARGVDVDAAVKKINKGVYDSSWKIHNYLRRP